MNLFNFRNFSFDWIIWNRDATSF